MPPPDPGKKDSTTPYSATQTQSLTPSLALHGGKLPMRQFFKELGSFVLKEAQSCLFAGSFFLILYLSNHLPLFGLARYDFLFLAAIGIQILLLSLKLESWEEVKVIFLFHIVGFVLEFFKTSPGVGSWSYPESGFLKIGTVPLYSGFMYSAVGSYINQAWKIMKLEYTGFPAIGWLSALSALIYLNFFTHHFLPDIRWWLIAAVFILFARTMVSFTLDKTPRRMPLALAFGLIGFFIWIAENISTWFGAWKYPDQLHQWAMVSPHKISSWFLLVIVSFNLVALLHRHQLVSGGQEHVKK